MFESIVSNVDRLRLLTKSRFNLARECPTKLFYADKPHYANKRNDDNFLQFLAEGGYQVGALARLSYPGGVTVDSRNHAEALERTRELLQQDSVTIYEGALAFDKLFIRADVLRKRGPLVELIEVKAKSYHPLEDSDLRGKRGGPKAEFLPYLWDVAFQRFVAEAAYPGLTFTSFLMMVDKSKAASVDGLNQMFPVRRVGRRVTVSPADDVEPGESILYALAVEGLVQELLTAGFRLGDETLPFGAAVSRLAEAYHEDRQLPARIGVVCSHCEFKTATMPVGGETRSGFHECWTAELGWKAHDFASGLVVDLFNFRKKDDLIASGTYKLSQVTSEDLGFDDSPPGHEGLSTKHRQSYQCTGKWPGGGPFYFDEAGFEIAMSEWRYPLNFIDFETCMSAIPFKAGRRPYEQTAFQFSHHVMTADGRVTHETQFLRAVPGECPNVAFVDALRVALEQNEGTIFRWSAHENTILINLREQMLSREPPSAHRDQLIAFIERVTTRKEDKGEREGERSMVDLCRLAERHFFHPQTKGSSSLKKVLPALMQCSERLKEIYGTPSYGTDAMPSRNLREPIAWWQQRNAVVLDPYDLLPPVFADFTKEEQAAMEANFPDELQEGGTAMAAYVRLQEPSLAPDQRAAIEAALLRYCELDTLAMVMVVQAWKAWAEDRA